MKWISLGIGTVFALLACWVPNRGAAVALVLVAVVCGLSAAVEHLIEVGLRDLSPQRPDGR